MPGVVAALEHVALGQQQLAAKVEQLASKVEQLSQPTIYDTTPSALGEETLRSLRELGAVHDFFKGTRAGGSAVLGGEAQRELAECSKEEDIVKFITPVLWHLRVADDTDPCSPVLVNTALLLRA